VEYPFPAAVGKKTGDRVVVLSDFGPDGRARKAVTFADDLNIPIGVLPLPGKNDRALVFSIPNIWLLEDTDGDGKADVRKILYSRIDQRDTHGLTNAFTWGFDGWIYACHGFANTSTLKGQTDESITMNSGNTYRIKDDGSRIEQFTWGQVNPFGLCFDPLGNVYTADCHTKPLYQLHRGAYYPSFGKPHDGLGFGPEMVNHTHGSTAISGVVHYSANHFPHAYRDTVFIGNVVTNRINHDRIEWRGSSPHAVEQPDFLTSEDPWFRPVDLQLGPDGALYVADFYNRIIGHYEVPLNHPGRDRTRGRIWRIVHKGPQGDAPPPAPIKDRSQSSVEELVADLADPNFTVRMHATTLLARQDRDAIQKPLEAVLLGKDEESEQQAWQRSHALWVLERTGSLPFALLRKAAQGPALLVRVHAQRVLSERPKVNEEERKLIVAGLSDADAQVQRAAADALGRHPTPDGMAPLLTLHHGAKPQDTHLKHVVRMALRNHLRDPKAWKSLPLPDWTARDEDVVREVAFGVPTPEAAGYLVKALRGGSPSGDFAQRSAHHVARHGDKDAVRQILEFARKGDDVLQQSALFKAIHGGTEERGAALDDDVREWGTQLADRLLASTEAGKVRAGADLVGLLGLGTQEDRLVKLATGKHPLPTRQAALDSLFALGAVKHAPTIAGVLGDGDTPMSLREHAAGLLTRANQPETLDLLVAQLAVAPARLQAVIAAGLAGTSPGAERLLKAVGDGKASPRLLQERVVDVRLNNSGLPGLKERLEQHTRGLPPVDQKIQDLMKERREGFARAAVDPALGARLFEKHCAICHQVGGKGAKIGPQLDGVGLRGLDRLLEDTLDPNRNVDQAFRLTALELKDGQVVTGLLLREEGAVLILADQQGKEVRVPGGNVEARSTAQMSPMPANIAELITPDEFYNLMAYVLAAREKPPSP
jgi:putative heme-binding domain-containing protein